MGEEEVAEEKGAIICRYPEYVGTVGLYMEIRIGTMLTQKFTYQTPGYLPTGPNPAS